MVLPTGTLGHPCVASLIGSSGEGSPSFVETESHVAWAGFKSNNVDKAGFELLILLSGCGP